MAIPLRPDEQQRLAQMANAIYGPAPTPAPAPIPSAPPSVFGATPSFEMPPPPKPGPLEHATPARQLDSTLPPTPAPGISFKPNEAKPLIPPAAPAGPAPSVDFMSLAATPSRLVSKAGYQPHSRTTRVTEGTQFSPETKEAVDTATQASKRGIALQTEAEREKAEREARTANMQANLLEADRAEDKLRRDHQTSQLQAQSNELDSLVRDQKARSVDPRDYWGGKNAFQKIMIGISLALGGGVAAKTGKNPGLEMLNRDIDDFVNGQKFAVEKGQKDIENQKGILAQLKERFGDEDRAVAAGRILAKEQLQSQIQALSAGTNDKLVRARGEMLMAQNAEEIAKLRAHFDELGSKKIEQVAQESYRPAVYAGGGTALQKLQNAVKTAQAIKELKQLGFDVGNLEQAAQITHEKGRRELDNLRGAGNGLKIDDAQFVPTGKGVGIVARSKEEGVTLRNKIAARDAIVSNLKQIAELDRNANFLQKGAALTEYNERRRGLIKDTNTKKTVFEGQGAQSRGDEEVSEAANGVLTGLAQFTGNSELMINDAIGRINTAVDSVMHEQGGPTVQQSYRRDENGMIVPSYIPISPEQPPSPTATPQGFKEAK